MDDAIITEDLITSIHFIIHSKVKKYCNRIQSWSNLGDSKEMLDGS
jgi:hypothetical protein